MHGFLNDLSLYWQRLEDFKPIISNYDDMWFYPVVIFVTVIALFLIIFSLTRDDFRKIQTINIGSDLSAIDSHQYAQKLSSDIVELDSLRIKQWKEFANEFIRRFSSPWENDTGKSIGEWRIYSDFVIELSSPTIGMSTHGQDIQDLYSQVTRESNFMPIGATQRGSIINFKFIPKEEK